MNLTTISSCEKEFTFESTLKAHIAFFHKTESRNSSQVKQLTDKSESADEKVANRDGFAVEFTKETTIRSLGIAKGPEKSLSIVEVKKVASIEKIVFPCLECDRDFTDREEFSRHETEKHAKKEPKEKRRKTDSSFPCNECDAKFETTRELIRHRRFYHNS